MCLTKKMVGWIEIICAVVGAFVAWNEQNYAPIILAIGLLVLGIHKVQDEKKGKR